MKKEYIVSVVISGYATVCTKAESKEEAIENVNNGDFYGGELDEWDVEEAVNVLTRK